MYILQVTPVLIETVGGFTINAKSEVTTLLGKPIARGLFGAGTTGMTAGREAAKLSA